MTAKKKIVLITVAVVLVAAIAVTAMALLIPRTGKKIKDEWSADSAFSLNSVQTLQKTSGEEFVILMMTDIQLWSNLSDNAKTFELMDQLVKETRPDLIVLPGDNVSGLTTAMYVRSFVSKMDSYKIPWAPTFGNHDSEGNATLEWQADRFAESEYCMFQRGPSNLYGCGNYAINIKEDDKIVQTLFFFDNGRYSDYGENIGKKETPLLADQIAWYQWNVEGIAAANGGEVVPSMTFSHFAQPEFRTAMETLAEKKKDVIWNSANDVWYVPEELGFGYCKYLPGVAPVNSGFIETAKKLGSTKYVFCGHDHENNASILYEGITYTYGLKTGCSPRYWNGAKEYGGTVVTLGADNAVSIKNKVLHTVE